MSKRTPIIIGNWKMNKTDGEAKEFVAAIEKVVPEGADFGFGVPFTALSASLSASKKLIIAAQNCHYEDSGAYTGEISADMLLALGIKWCIIGHSERRQYFGDSDETVNKKAKKLFEKGLTPILCCGETLEQFEAGETEAVVRGQLAICLKDLSVDQIKKLVIAYEPIWAIGTGRNATREIASSTCALVRDQVKVMFGEEAAAAVRIQYGGSVKPENIAEYLGEPDIDGALIGGASLKLDSFTAIMEAVKA